MQLLKKKAYLLDILETLKELKPNCQTNSGLQPYHALLLGVMRGWLVKSCHSLYIIISEVSPCLLGL